MSVIGTVAAAAGVVSAGVGLGQKGIGYMFNYTKEKYESKISELETSISRLNKHLEILKELKSQIPKFWNDDSAQRTAKALDVTIQKVEQQMNTSESLMKTFRTTVNAMDSSKEELDKNIEEALSVLNLLDL